MLNSFSQRDSQGIENVRSLRTLAQKYAGCNMYDVG